MGMLRRPQAILAALLALSQAACSGVPPTQTPQASASPTVQPGSSEPSAAPSGSAPATQQPGQASADPVETSLLRGRVFDAAARPAPDGTRVSVRSLDTARPFDTTVETRDGLYVVTAAPVGVLLEVSATRDGWTRRTRVEALKRNERNLDRLNVINFGGQSDANDPAGLTYFISDYPEIERVEPVDEATSLPNDKMTFKLVMSEALDVANQRRLAAGFLIVPNSQEALDDATALPDHTATSEELTGLRAGSSPITTSPYRYRQNAGFLNGQVLSDFKWEADNRTATFSLAAPVKTGNAKEAEYAFLLVQQDDEQIKDQQGQPLGMTAGGEFGRTLRNEIIHNAVKEPEVSLALTETDDAEERWAGTHLTYTTFSVSTDQAAPKVVGVRARRNYVDDAGGASDRIEVTFSEPMIAYPRVAGSQVLSLNNYILAAAATEAELAERRLADDGTAADILSGAGFSTARTAIEGVTGGVIGSNGDTMSGDYRIAVSVNDPKVVILSLPAGALPLEANFLKVYVGSDNNAEAGARKSVSDPAGNAISTSDNVQVGPIQ